MTDLPIIDWEQGIRLAGGKQDLAEEMLGLLIQTLPNDILTIKQAHDQQTRYQRIHRLHGAICYCGLPRLKNVLGQLETELKTSRMVNLPTLLDQLETEVTLLLEHYSRRHL
jgi:two-component system sensor histidine kinase BarA